MNEELLRQVAESDLEVEVIVPPQDIVPELDDEVREMMEVE